jgi:cytochrome c peroxidase
MVTRSTSRRATRTAIHSRAGAERLSTKRVLIAFVCLWLAAVTLRWPAHVPLEVSLAAAHDTALDAEVASALAAAGFTGTVEARLEGKLGRHVNLRLANLGRLLWFDTLLSLHHDNACGGCH